MSPLKFQSKTLAKFALILVDITLISIVILVAKNILLVSPNLLSKKPPLDSKPEISTIPTLPKISALSLNSLSNPKEKPGETNVSQDTIYLLKLINSERLNNGLSPLSLDSNLSKIASDYSKSMAQKNFFSHTDPNGNNPEKRLSDNGIVFEMAGENIAYSPSIDSAHKNLMNSKEHRDNILNSAFSKVGIGITKVNESKILFTEVFTN